MSYKRSLTFLAFVLAMNGWTRAQILDTPVDPVLNSGSTIFAFDVYDGLLGTTTTVNGIVFSGADTDAFTASGFQTLTLSSLPTATVPTAFETIMIAADEASGNSASIVLNDLTQGATYQFQLFAGVDGEAGPTIYKTDSLSQITYGDDGNGSYWITDTFVAMHANETIYLAPVTDGVLAYNAIDLRKQAVLSGSANPTPEPSTTGLLLTGAAACLLLRRLAGNRLAGLLGGR